MLERGARVTVIDYKGNRLQRRVWDEAGEGVFVCSEQEYRRAIRERTEPLCVGFPRADVLEIREAEVA